MEGHFEARPPTEEEVAETIRRNCLAVIHKLRLSSRRLAELQGKTANDVRMMLAMPRWGREDGHVLAAVLGLSREQAARSNISDFLDSLTPLVQLPSNIVRVVDVELPEPGETA